MIPPKNKKTYFIQPVIRSLDGKWKDDAEYFVFRAEESSAPCLKELSLSAVSSFSNAFYTIIMDKEAFQLNECKNYSKALGIVDNNLILGLSQIIDLRKMTKMY